MKAIAIFNNKGGVGKTTLLCNLASYLKIRENKRVLVIDADPQCNASIYLMNPDLINDIYTANSPNTIYNIIYPLRKGKDYVKEGEIPIMHSEGFDIDVIVGDTRFAVTEDFLSADWLSGKSGDPRGLKTTFIFKDLLLKLKDKYDFVFFDIGPSLGAINRVVLLACDYFIIPMSSDIFSLKAVDNISESLLEWKKGVERGLRDYESNEKEKYTMNNNETTVKLEFLGYINQQYTAKRKEGIIRPVKAYENIIRKMPTTINHRLIAFYPKTFETSGLLVGEIPTLNSLIPLSQSANKPIFKLTGNDGVVGAHFKKVTEFESVIKQISINIQNNIEAYDKLAK
jgi:cellulose biosynthesis protein BcsQ